MDNDQIERLGVIIAEQMNKSHQDHDDHHEFIEAIMKREEKKQARWEKIQTSVIGSVALLVLGSVGKLVMMGFDAWVKSK
jgi:hypothetical protein